MAAGAAHERPKFGDRDAFGGAAVGDAVDMGSGVETSIADTVALIQSPMGTQALVETDQ